MDTLGLDGCRKGWVQAVSSHGECTSLQVIASLEEIETEAWKEIWIDIPIGLPPADDYPRTVEKEARRLLQQRRSSVFSVPCREVLAIENYAEANQLHRELTGKGISKQTWNLISKIKETDNWVQKKQKDLVYEAHPELVFAGLAGAPMQHNKKTEAGFRERLQVLETLQTNKGRLAAQIESALQKYPTATAVRDDFLDAAALSIAGSHPGVKKISLEADPRKDAHGLVMNMRYSVPYKR